jgi:hypothetical protein
MSSFFFINVILFITNSSHILVFLLHTIKLQLKLLFIIIVSKEKRRVPACTLLGVVEVPLVLFSCRYDGTVLLRTHYVIEKKNSSTFFYVFSTFQAGFNTCFVIHGVEKINRTQNSMLRPVPLNVRWGEG